MIMLQAMSSPRIFLFLSLMVCGFLGVHDVHGQDKKATTLDESLERYQQAMEQVNRNDIMSKSSAGSLGSATSCIGGFAGPYPCDQVDLLSFLPITTFGEESANDIWGWTDPESGREYALLGLRDGTAFIDVTDPESPLYLGKLPTHTIAAGWRDIKVYRDHAYIVADNADAHGLQIFDLRELRSVASPPVIFDETAHYDEFGSAHNIAINEASGIAYVVGANSGGTTCGGGLHMVKLQKPNAPSFAGCFADPTTGRSGTGYTHDVQCVIYDGPDRKYRGKEICIGSNETAISIADVTKKNKPKALSTASYPSVAYTHQGWLSEDHAYFFQNDELDELGPYYDCVAICTDGDTACRDACFIQHIINAPPTTSTFIWDVSDLDDPILVNTLDHSTTAIDHNLYVKGNVLFESNYSLGLRIFDITDPEAPSEFAFFDTYTPHDFPLFSGSWSNYPFFRSGNIIVSSRGEGLFVLRPGPDSDGDTVLDPNDYCPATSLSEGVPTKKLKRGRWALTDGDHTFDTKGRLRGLPYSIADTRGCSCEQIIDELDLGTHHEQYGCTNRAMKNWIAYVETASGGGAGKVISIPELDEVRQPTAHVLQSNYPNPFNPETIIRFELAKADDVALTVFDLQGREVARLVEGRLSAGKHEATFDARRLPSGTYLYRLDTSQGPLTGQMVLMK